MSRKAKSKSVHTHVSEMKNTEETQENNCVVCFKGVDTYSIGQCDHPVCFECSTRMRVLCKQNECPICRQEMPLVFFTKTVRPYKQLVTSNIFSDKKYKIEFEDEAVRNSYIKLLEHSCPKCSDKTFNAFHQLQDHVRRVHQLNYCDLCVENLKIFTFERRVYTRHELVSHRRAGDADDKSHKGHPICEFCDIRYMDSDELFRHLRRDHLYCHFCDADGYHRYYNSYSGLRDHFSQEHYLCEEGECSDEQFTSVFRTEIDLKAHKASAHGRLMGKVGLKQTRTLELEFTLAPRQRSARSRNHHNRDDEEAQVVPVEEVETVYHQVGINTDCIEEFPCLGGASTAAPANNSAPGRLMMGGQRLPFRNRNNFSVTDENFPVLGNPAPAAPPPTVNVTVSNGPPHGRAVKTTAVSILVGSSKPQMKTVYLASNFPNLSQSSNFPALSSSASTSTVINPEWSEPKPKPVAQPQPKPPPKPTFSMDTSQFPSLSLGETPSASSSKKSKNKKNKSSQQLPQPPQASQPQPIVQPEQSEPKPVKSEKSKKKQKDPDKSEVKPEPKVKPLVKNNDNNKQKSKNQENKPQEMKQQKNKKEKKVENKTEKNKKESNCETNNNIVVNGDRLGLITEELMKMPPPGFGPAPPPGFGRLKPPPGLGLPPPGFAVHSYLMPRNFAKRNKKLITEVVASVGEDYYEQFKKISGMFRNNVVTAEDYVEHCSSMMGRTSFDSLFPELLALLPDINKQQELWNAMDESTKRSLDACETCRQVLTKGDLPDHLAQHAANLDNPNFPPLPSLLPLS